MLARWWKGEHFGIKDTFIGGAARYSIGAIDKSEHFSIKDIIGAIDISGHVGIKDTFIGGSEHGDGSPLAQSILFI